MWVILYISEKGLAAWPKYTGMYCTCMAYNLQIQVLANACMVMPSILFYPYIMIYPITSSKICITKSSFPKRMFFALICQHQQLCDSFSEQSSFALLFLIHSLLVAEIHNWGSPQWLWAHTYPSLYYITTRGWPRRLHISCMDRMCCWFCQGTGWPLISHAVLWLYGLLLLHNI